MIMKEKETKGLSDPTPEDEMELDSIRNATPTYVTVRGKEWKCDWIKAGTERKVTSIMLDENTDEDKVVCKCAAALKLNGLWSIKFFYAILWRWYYYVKEYREDELLPFITECKKKVIVDAYLIATMSLTAMKDTIMNKNRQEVNRFQAELLSAQLSVSQKSSQTS